MPLGTEVDLGPGHIVLDGDPAPIPERGTAAPVFGTCVLRPNGRPSQLLLSTCFSVCRVSIGSFLAVLDIFPLFCRRFDHRPLA